MNAIAIVGPTAAGKSDLAVQLALRLGGEVVNADSMQLYRGMDVGTAKLDMEERKGVPHHLLDIWDVTQTASVADYQRAAREAIAAIQERGRVPLLVGGSGLYIRAVIDDLDFPGTDPELRARLEAELADVGPAALHARLARLDPAAAASILPGNGRRIVRALEVIEMTGRPFSASMPSYEDAKEDVTQVGLAIARPELDERIEARVERMWSAGLVEEVRRLEPYGLRDGLTASRATVRATRRFARRQESWFRRDPRVRWVGYDTPVQRVLDTIESCDS
jgi:tRNA dimethylallyltransferase